MALYLGNNKIASGAITNGSSSGGDTTPIGVILEYSIDNPPENWLICDGSAISRTTYSELFNVIGTTYGSGDGSTTFNLPNLKGRVPVGKDSSQTEFATINKTGGEKTHKLIINEMPSHGHTIPYGPSTYGDTQAVNKYIPQNDTFTEETNGKGWSNGGTSPAGGNQSHNNLQPYIVVNYIIKVAKEIVTSSVNEIYNAIWPIGRGFIDFTNTDYSNWLGLTWERELVGMTAVGLDTAQTEFNTIGKTGGEKTHKLTSNEIPKTDVYGSTIGGSGDRVYKSYTNNGISNTFAGVIGQVAGGEQPHNNLQPYKVVAYWKRVA